MVTAIGSEPGSLQARHMRHHVTKQYLWITTQASSLAGVGLALLSNLCYALRNTGMKMVCKGKLNVADFGLLSAVGFVILTLPMAFLLCVRTKAFLEMFNTIVSLDDLHHAMMVLAGVFHAIYNIISMTIILTMFSPIQHALLNVGKRVTVVLGFFIITFSTASSVSLLNVFSAVSCITIIVLGNRHLKVNSEHSHSMYKK